MKGKKPPQKQNPLSFYLIEEKLIQILYSGFKYKIQEKVENIIKIRSRNDYVCLDNSVFKVQLNCISFKVPRSKGGCTFHYVLSIIFHYLLSVIFLLSLVNLMFTWSSENSLETWACVRVFPALATF